MKSRLTLRQTAQLLGGNIGDVLKLCAKDGRFFDPSFPAMARGSFNEAEIRAWLAAKAGLPAVTEPAAAPIPAQEAAK